MIKAGIDIGTHTGRLIIAEVSDNKIINILHKQAKIIALGEGTSKTGKISPAALKRAISLLKVYSKTIENFQAENIKAVTTNAVRLASNSNEVLVRIKEESGINLEVISGETEARLGYLGIKSAFSGEDFVAFDIGGGSTEFTLNQNDSLVNAISLPVGAVSLTERFCHSDPIANSDFDQIFQAAHQAIHQVYSVLKESYKLLIGVAGTVTNLAAIKQEMSFYDPEKIHKSRLSLLDIDGMICDFRHKTIAMRKKIIGLEPQRAQVILAGALLVKCILEASPLTTISVSERDLLEGLVLA